MNPIAIQLKEQLVNNLCNAIPSFRCLPTQTLCPERSVEGRWSLSDKQLGACCLGDTVRKREFEVLSEELLDVWALHVVGLLKFNNLEDLFFMLELHYRKYGIRRT